MEPTRALAWGSLGGILSPPLVSVAGECIKDLCFNLSISKNGEVVLRPESSAGFKQMTR